MSLVDRLISTEHPESPQLLTVALAAMVLPVVLGAIGGACVYRIAKVGDLGSGACWALGLSVAALAICAGFANEFKTIRTMLPKTPNSEEESQ